MAEEIESITNLGQIILYDEAVQNCALGWMDGWEDGWVDACMDGWK